MSSIMKCIRIKTAGKVFPTGDPSFSVKQAFPHAFSAEEVDPFLMCDHFGPAPSKGLASDPDSFEVGWHPHRGMDIMTYLKEGVGRHADSLGNRGEYKTPGMQWISVGSGIEHAEGGGTPAGMTNLGFQIWINTPSKFKMNDPEYGVETPEDIPIWSPLNFPGVSARILAGEVDGLKGPFRTKQDVQIVDIEILQGKNAIHVVPRSLDSCVLYVYDGSGTISNTNVSQGSVLLMDAKSNDREIPLLADDTGLRVIIFAGKRIGEPIAWRGPFVMNTQQEIQKTIQEYQSGTFLKKRASWDYKKISTKPVSVDRSDCL